MGERSERVVCCPATQRSLHMWLIAEPGRVTATRYSPPFAATAEASEEAIYNAIFKATTVESKRGSLTAIPLEDLYRVLDRHNLRNRGEQTNAVGATMQ